MNENNDEESSDHEQLMQELMMGLMTNNIPITVDTMMNAFRVHTLIGGAKSGSMDVVKMILDQHDLNIDALNHVCVLSKCLPRCLRLTTMLLHRQVIQL